MTLLRKPKSLTPIATSAPWIVEDVRARRFRVDRAALVDDAVFRNEMCKIFDRCWLYVGHESEIPKPGDFRARDVGNRPVVFWHGHDGVKRVFYYSCRHRGALVCRLPHGNAKGMHCFYHWNWSEFPASFFVAQMVDQVVGCFLAGLVIARVAPVGKASPS
jgi:benzoate/toluate 1,2-dioxygenase alpha subunit/p-cumate 2,3-dioxygenase alpha subunit